MSDRSVPSNQQLYVTLKADVAHLIRRVFLPINPNKMRGADPRVVAAAHQMIAAIGVAKPMPLWPEGEFTASDGKRYRVVEVTDETPAECPGHYKVAARNVCTMFPHCLCSPEARAAEATEDARHQKATCGWGGAYGLCVLEPDHDGPHEIPRHPKTSAGTDHG